MPPSKVKLHKNTGKSNGPQKKLDPTENQGLTASQEEQFQSELYWCINQLQQALSLGKLNSKQVQEHTKALNTLMNNNAPMVKKRQVMRLSFGDYRTKMVEEEKKAKKVSMKISSKGPSEKSQFIKKALGSGNGFQFNFEQPHEEKSEKVALDESKSVIFVKSDNSFRFNFTDNEGIS